jgi:hypothetical protein
VNDHRSVSGRPLPGSAPRSGRDVGRGANCAAPARTIHDRLRRLERGDFSWSRVHRYGLIACLPWLAARCFALAVHGVPRAPVRAARCLPGTAAGAWPRFLHRRFDHPHWQHHREPWNRTAHQRHPSTTTAPVALALAVAAILLPQPAGAVSFASFLLSYLLQEWDAPERPTSAAFAAVTSSTVRRHHLYHHGSRDRHLRLRPHQRCLGPRRAGPTCRRSLRIVDS